MSHPSIPALRALFAAAVLASSLLVVPSAFAQTGPKTVTIETPPDAWQTHRRQTFEWMRAINNDKLPAAQREVAYKKFDALLTQFEKNPFSITPMEGMDLMQYFYVPREPDKMSAHLMMVAALATAGWFDALRFGDESGRVEIVNNEEFYKRALMTQKDAFIEFITNKPEEAALSVKKGIQFAANAQGNIVSYDTHWPASYGLLRLQCGLEKRKVCEKPKELPQKEWDDAFKQAAERVTRYYRINKD